MRITETSVVQHCAGDNNQRHHQYEYDIDNKSGVLALLAKGSNHDEGDRGRLHNPRPVIAGDVFQHGTNKQQQHQPHREKNEIIFFRNMWQRDYPGSDSRRASVPCSIAGVDRIDFQATVTAAHGTR